MHAILKSKAYQSSLTQAPLSLVLPFLLSELDFQKQEIIFRLLY